MPSSTSKPLHPFRVRYKLDGVPWTLSWYVQALNVNAAREAWTDAFAEVEAALLYDISQLD